VSGNTAKTDETSVATVLDGCANTVAAAEQKHTEKHPIVDGATCVKKHYHLGLSTMILCGNRVLKSLNDSLGIFVQQNKLAENAFWTAFGNTCVFAIVNPTGAKTHPISSVSVSATPSPATS
jgi:hypothetical protein